MPKKYDLDEIKQKAIDYIATQNTPVTLRTIAKRINTKLKVVRYVLFNNTDIFKSKTRYINTNRYVYTV